MTKSEVSLKDQTVSEEEKKDLLEALELYYRTFFLEEDVDWEESRER